MLQRKFMHVRLKDLRESIHIEIHAENTTHSFQSFAYVEHLLENKNCSKASVVFIFPKNKDCLSRSHKTIWLQWNCKKYITWDVFKLKPHLLICVAFEDIGSVHRSVQSPDQAQASMTT